ncbi:hypothetical protein Ahy_A01g002921 isoform D [Arachis hypogaea]|uniref:Uncharacterized protein n=1 Tax=Arachis hypogaea TaxID=3818 RepID=A0A445ERS5_ARAHY|nr:hypothetical protein Ahy_A01g002921 isoform D [Arachis hypogaea]
MFILHFCHITLVGQHFTESFQPERSVIRWHSSWTHPQIVWLNALKVAAVNHLPQEEELRMSSIRVAKSSIGVAKSTFARSSSDIRALLPVGV